MNCTGCGYTSEIADAIMHSNGEPATIASANAEQVTVEGEIGIYVNKTEADCFTSPISIDNYPLNKDKNPLVVNKQSNGVPCVRKVYVKYLEPPAIPTPKPVIINQEANILAPEAPPIIIRQKPAEQEDPAPLVIREIPPDMPRAPTRKIVNIPGKILPPPARKVIIEKLPELPDPPQNVFIERWLPFKDIKRKIILRPRPNNPRQCKPKNIIVNWSIIPCCRITQEIKDLGVEQCDPIEYLQAYGESLIPSDQLPEIADTVNDHHGKLLAANQNIKYFNALEGDLHALQLIESELGLENEGLTEFKHLLNYLDSNKTQDDNTNTLSNLVLSANSKKIHICEDGICRLINQIEIEKEEASAEEEDYEEENDEKSDYLDSVESTSYDIDGSTSSASDFTILQ